VSGPFEITPVSVELSRHLDYQDRTKSAIVKLKLVIAGEPKLSNSGTHAQARLKRCVDDRGQSLLLEDKRTFLSDDAGTRSSWTILIELAEPRPGRRIKELQGELSVAVGIAQRYLAITNLLHAPAQSREFDGIKITSQPATKTDAQHYDLDIQLSAPAGSPCALTFPGPEEPNVALWDQRLEGILRPDLYIAPNGIKHESGRDISSWHLSCNRAPEILTWLTPDETRWLTVPFELRDLPVP
jgi:hypothetical protein